MFFCATLFASTSLSSPIKFDGKFLHMDFVKTDCNVALDWLSTVTKKNIIMKQSKQKIILNWQKITPEDAWQQLQRTCDFRFTEQPMVAVKLYWLILDNYAESNLGLNLNNLIIQPKNLKPSAKLWNIVSRIKSWEDVFNYILKDLNKSSHIFTLSDPYILTLPEHASIIKTNILMPYLVKTTHSTYNSMQILPIDLQVKTKILKNTINLIINSNMQDRWPKYDVWPIAIHSISTTLNLKPNEFVVVAKENFISTYKSIEHHKYLSNLRDKSEIYNKLKKIYVIVSAKIISV